MTSTSQGIQFPPRTIPSQTLSEMDVEVSGLMIRQPTLTGETWYVFI